jgi:adenylate cyclase
VTDELEPWLEEVIEPVAREVHDTWWRRRASEGWTHGPARDDAAREHPSMIPYDELSEEERDYDRATIRATLRGLRTAGYRVVPVEEAGSDAAPAHGPEWFVAAAEAALREGKPLVAFEITTQGLTGEPAHVRLRQLQALSLARSGAPGRASTILEALAAEGCDDEETLGLLGRTRKDAALSTADPELRAARLRESLSTYERSYRATGGYYTGINAATLALLCGERERSRELAREVEAIARSELTGGAEDSPAAYYALATLAEAALLQGDEAAAAGWLARAAAVGRERFGDVASTRRNLRLVLESLGRDPRVLDRWLPIPRVGIVIGTGPSWSRAAEERVEPPLRAAVDRWVEENGVGFLYAGAAPGVDLLACERVQALGGRSYLVLTHEAGAPPAPGAGDAARWAERLERVEACADERLVATEQHLPGTSIFERFADELRLGLALVHARLLETGIAVLDLGAAATAGPPPGGGRGGTDGVRVHRLDLKGIAGAGEPPVDPAGPSASAALPEGEGPYRIAAVLFADVLKYSALEDRQIPAFVEHFLGLVGEVADRSDFGPLARNTWGDGLYFVFSGVRDAGLFALELQARIASTDWEAVGLRPDLALRVGLHAGPVFGCTDPVTAAAVFTGRHTVRAARIEPVTPPGMIYGSREFAALATAAGVREFACEPVGRVDLAKGAANLPLFVVRRVGETS